MHEVSSVLPQPSMPAAPSGEAHWKKKRVSLWTCIIHNQQHFYLCGFPCLRFVRQPVPASKQTFCDSAPLCYPVVSVPALMRFLVSHSPGSKQVPVLGPKKFHTCRMLQSPCFHDPVTFVLQCSPCSAMMLVAATYSLLADALPSLICGARHDPQAITSVEL
jgi:hypothetical protein